MTSMQPLPGRNEGPRTPRRVLVALAVGYAGGYAAAVGATGSPTDSMASAAVASAQGVIAAVFWIFSQKR
ncbi:hypothetical protein ACF06W_14190 [Streptomyces albus]|uniref:hypothetical protein n=1 Tax=Streptomyces albus TaxID=1888 RepID=UPI0036F8350B